MNVSHPNKAHNSYVKRLIYLLAGGCLLLLGMDLFHPPHSPLQHSSPHAPVTGIYLLISGVGLLIILPLSRLLGWLLRRREEFYDR
ncbi:MAG: hypothetical protein J7K75_09880 [Desulfuromonas sp.]|nr:hypothetical protein [Desulfuromonas sp.]